MDMSQGNTNMKEMDTFETKVLPVLEMNCAVCAHNVEHIVQELPGVKNAIVNYAANTLTVMFSPSKITSKEIQAAVRATGYDLIIEDEVPEILMEGRFSLQYNELRRNTIIAWLLAVPLGVIALFFMNIPYANLIMMLLVFTILVFPGRSFYLNGLKGTLKGQPDMNTLIALGTFIAFAFSLFNTFYPQYWYERSIESRVCYEISGMVVAVALLGKLLEELAERRLIFPVKKLMELQSKTVRKLVDGKEDEVPVFKLQPGDIMSIQPGESIPADGIVIKGKSSVDESILSGATVSIEKTPGDKVLAGTMNRTASFLLQVTETGNNTVLGRIIRSVKCAQGSKAPVQYLVDKVGVVFIPIVILVAILVFTGWLIWGGQQYIYYAVISAVSVLVIACPCALALATSTAVMEGIRKAAIKHILIKDAYTLETLSKVDTVVVDKTGTLTEGIPKVTDSLWLAEPNICYLDILYTAELRSEHPLAKAITNWLVDSGATEFSPQGYESLPGMGIRIEVRDETYWVGNQLLADYFQAVIPPDVKRSILEMQSRNMTVIYYGGKNQLLAVLGISDRIKPTAALAVKDLKEEDIEVHMLTEDGECVASSVSLELGIPFYEPEVLPDEKEKYIRALKQAGKKVAMVGDGVNDSKALARADVSVTMEKVSGIPVDVAKVKLMASDLTLLPEAITIARRTVSRIRQNLSWVFIYNLIAIPLAAGILFLVSGLVLNPIIAAVAMAFSSLSVVMNSLRQ